MHWISKMFNWNNWKKKQLNNKLGWNKSQCLLQNNKKSAEWNRIDTLISAELISFLYPYVSVNGDPLERFLQFSKLSGLVGWLGLRYVNLDSYRSKFNGLTSINSLVSFSEHKLHEDCLNIILVEIKKYYFQ